MPGSPTGHTDVGIGGERTRNRSVKLQPRSRTTETLLQSHPVEEYWQPGECSRSSLMQSMPRSWPGGNLAPEAGLSTGDNPARLVQRQIDPTWWNRETERQSDCEVPSTRHRYVRVSSSLLQILRGKKQPSHRFIVSWRVTRKNAAHICTRILLNLTAARGELPAR